MKTYTYAEILEIVRQLEAITVNGERVFLAAVIRSDTVSAYHRVDIDTQIGVQTLEFAKYQKKEWWHE